MYYQQVTLYTPLAQYHVMQQNRPQIRTNINSTENNPILIHYNPYNRHVIQPHTPIPARVTSNFLTNIHGHQNTHHRIPLSGISNFISSHDNVYQTWQQAQPPKVSFTRYIRNNLRPYLNALHRRRQAPLGQTQGGQD